MKTRYLSDMLTHLVLLIALPLVIFSQLSIWQSFAHSNDLIARSNQRLARSWAEQTDERLNQLTHQVYNFVYSQGEFADFAAQHDETDYHLALVGLTGRLDELLNAFPEISALFVSHLKKGQLVDRFFDTSYLGYAKRQELRKQVGVRNLSEDYDFGGKWQQLKAGETAYLLSSFQRDAVRLYIFIEVERLNLQTDSGITALFSDLHGQFITQTGFAESEKIAPLTSDNGFQLSQGGYMVVSHALRAAPIRLAIAVEKSTFWDRLTPVQIVFLVTSLLTVLWPLYGHRQLKRFLLIPLAALSNAMDSADEIEKPVQLQEAYEVWELDHLRKRFNQMTSRIVGLRIQSYERELKRQQVELQYLHLQIRPHFLLNCLKGVSASLQSGHIDEAGEMILAFSKHLRYLFTENLKVVTIKEELDHARNYLHIRQMSMSCPPVLHTQVDRSLLSSSILPFCIQTFVENAVKHRYIEGDQLKIEIRVRNLHSEAGSFMNLIVKNNGGGFSDETLRAVNSESINIYDSAHVGLNNIRARLRLMYGDKAVLAFYNQGDEAVVDMLWPFEPPDEEGGTL